MKDKFYNILSFTFSIMTFGASLVRLISNKYIDGFIPLSLACFLLIIYLQEKKNNKPIIFISILLIMIGYIQIFNNL